MVTQWKWEVTQQTPLSDWMIAINPSDIMNMQTIARCYSSKYDARLIVSAVNACKEFNPYNPMAAAESMPKLLKALEMIVEHFRNNDENYYQSDLCMDAIAAITKVKGKV